jgi:diguanylate cyclase (GGDEF)-like protein
MRLSLFDGGWHGPSVQQGGVFDYLLFSVEGATARTLQIRLDHGVFERVNPGQPSPKREAYTERLTMLALDRIAVLGREHLDQLLSDKMKHPTFAINVEEGDAEELRRLPGEKVCKYQSTAAGDLYCSVATSPLPQHRPGQTTRHLCGGCSLPDSRVACVHLQHAVIGFHPGEMPSVLEAQCNIGRPDVKRDASMCRPGGHSCWAKDVEFAPQEDAPTPEVGTPADGRVKDQKFGILDAPRQLEVDLPLALGIQGLALLYLDIDHFKQMNTRHTERVVDKTVLPQFQQLVADVTRCHGHAYAEGGDEVVVLLPNFSPAMAIAFASDLFALVRSTVFVVGGATESLTISAGLAIARSSADVGALADRANLAKKYSKEHGRDRLSVWTPSGCKPCPVETPRPPDLGEGATPTNEQPRPSYGTLDELFEEREKEKRGR